MIERTCQDCENRPEDLLTTRRPFLNRMGLGFGALSPGGTSADNLRSAFLPGAYQGTSVNIASTQIDNLIENIKNHYVSLPEQRKQLDLLPQLNEVHARYLKKDGQLAARLQADELAYQMQMEATDAFDLDHEKLTDRYNGRDFRLTDVYGNVVKQIIA